jgi:hypothetical protein
VNVHVHIDRLVVREASLSRRERDALGPAIERELARLHNGSAEPAGIARPGVVVAPAAGDSHPVAARIAREIHHRARTATGQAGRPR